MRSPSYFFLSLTLAGAFAACLDPDEPGNLVPKTVVEDPSLPRIEVNGTVLHAETFGDPRDPMIMVLHGGPGGDYRALLPLRALADEGYFVVFWDQRGAGLSKRHSAGEYTMELVLEDLRQVIDYYGERPMVFIGHSWGAMYATWFIDTYGSYGGRVRGAVLSEPGGFTMAQLESFAGRLSGSVDLFDERANDFIWADGVVTPDDHARADYKAMIQSAAVQPAVHVDPNNPSPQYRSGAVVNAALFALIGKHGFDWTKHLSNFTTRVLFLRGELNEAATFEHQRELAGCYPNSEMVTMPGVGHEMIWEQPAEYLHEVRGYLGSIGFTGGAR